MEFQVAKEKAIKYVFVAKKTEYEVRTKLKRIGYEDEIIDKVILFLKDYKYIDDNDYIDAYLRQNMRLLKYSIYEIKQKLLQKGINKCIIEEKLQNFKKTNYENLAIEKITIAKSKIMDELKLKQYLYRRGFVKNDFEN